MPPAMRFSNAATTSLTALTTSSPPAVEEPLADAIAIGDGKTSDA